VKPRISIPSSTRAALAATRLSCRQTTHYAFRRASGKLRCAAGTKRMQLVYTPAGGEPTTRLRACRQRQQARQVGGAGCDMDVRIHEPRHERQAPAVDLAHGLHCVPGGEKGGNTKKRSDAPGMGQGSLAVHSSLAPMGRSVLRMLQ
jgi:hypothetical protein